MKPCPSEKQLRQWLAGYLSEADGQTIESHVETCPNVCQALLDSLSGFEDDVPRDADIPPAERSVSVSLASSSEPGVAPPDRSVSASLAPPPVAESAEAGETPALRELPGYEILGRLGQGGMGVVYKARHRRMDRLVAIKVLPTGVVQDAAAVARFEREVKAAARLQHPNIVAAYDAAEADGVHFLVMEYVEGTDLAALVRHKGPLGVDQAVDCVLQAARGLDYAHRHGVVHRDVKPGNLLVDGEGVVKVLDMGLARFETAQDAGLTELTGMGQIMGTIDYMAPEQALDTRHADARADIYSLGLTLWYLLTGGPAFTGENALARLLAHREQPIPSLRGACPAAPPELEAIFMKMVAKRPEDRYQTMADVIAAVEDGLPRPSSNYAGTQASGTRERAGSINPQLNGSGALGGAALAAPVIAAAPAPTLTLNTAEFDADPNTEQSLDISASALVPRPPRRGRKLAVAAALVGLAAVAAAVFVIRVQTGEGEIIVESEAGGISVDIVRNGEPVKEDWQIHAGADNRWVVRTGTVEVKLPANLHGEFTLDQDTARLARDGKIVVKITRKKWTDALAAGQVFQPHDDVRLESATHGPTDRDRAAAEWVLAQGGKVAVSLDGKWGTLIARRDDLPAGRFKLVHAVLEGTATLRDDDLDRFANLDALRSFHLGGTPIGRDALTRLSKMRALESLNIGGTRIMTSDLPALAALPRLEFLSISAKSQADDRWAGLRSLASVRDLNVYGGSADDLRHLGELKQLRTIWLSDAPADVDEQDEQVVAQLQAANPLCRVLVGSKGTVRSVGRDPVAELAQRLLKKKARLEVLPFPPGSGPLLSANIEAEAAAGRPFDIRKIQLESGTAFDEEDLNLLRSPSSLTWCEAWGVVGADRCAAALADQPLLGGIYMGDSDLTDAGLAHLKSLRSLFELDVRGTQVTRAAVDELHAALPQRRISSDHGTFGPGLPTDDK